MAKKVNPQNFFKTQFDSMLQQFFPSFIRHKLNTELTNIKDKDILVVKVSPADRPIFMKTREGEEFYIRGEASSIPLYMEEAFKYIHANSKWQDYNRNAG